MAKEIDRVRAQSALAVIKQHPGMVLFVASPAIIALGLVWWLVGPALAVLLLVGHGASAAAPSCYEAQVEPRRITELFARGESRPIRL